MSGYANIWSVGGGKGGVGKSVATANIGCVLARRGESVILVDADLGGANLHTYFGIKYPPRGLEDFLQGRCAALADVALETPVKGLRLISGGGEFLGIANPAYARKQKLIRHIKKLEADHIIVDLGAGSSYNVLDFFALSKRGIVLLVPEPAAIQNAYIFLKSFIYRRLARLFSKRPEIAEMVRAATDARSPVSVKTFSDLCEKLSAVDRDAARAALEEVKGYRPRVLLNMAASDEDAKAAEAFMAASLTFLSLKTEYIGALRARPEVKAAARRMRPFMLDENAKAAHAELEAVVSNLLGRGRESAAGPSAPPVAAEQKAPARPQPARGNGAVSPEADGGAGEVYGYNDNVMHKGSLFHVQTEAADGDDPVVETVIYQGGRIFFSKRTTFKDIAEGTGAEATLAAFCARQHRAAMAAIKMNKIKTED